MKRAEVIERVEPAFPQALKPADFAGFMYGLKPVPFNEARTLQ
jgi:hypothetical protein